MQPVSAPKRQPPPRRVWRDGNKRDELTRCPGSRLHRTYDYVLDLADEFAVESIRGSASVTKIRSILMEMLRRSDAFRPPIAEIVDLLDDFDRRPRPGTSAATTAEGSSWPDQARDFRRCTAGKLGPSSISQMAIGYPECRILLIRSLPFSSSFRVPLTWCTRCGISAHRVAIYQPEDGETSDVLRA